jgi:serine/threonine protein kinase
VTAPDSKQPGAVTPPQTRRTASGSMAATRRSSGEMLAPGQPSSGEFRSANPQGDAFRPLVELGRGGMARVYLAEKTSRGLRRLVVLKVLEPSLSTDPEMRGLFRREAEVCARLHHPNVVQVFEVVDEAASPFMVMEYVEGVSLSQMLARTEQRLPTRLHVHVLMQVLAGLHYFHELRDEAGHALHGVHRDISPQNVIVMYEGPVKVLDFGIAKLRDPDNAEVTRAGIIKGKLSYMPPEQLVGDATIDRRADIFAVGVMLWEAFARRRIWQGWEQHNVMKALVSGNIPSIREACPWISGPLEQVVTRALAPKRDDRFATALEMQLALEECMPELGGFVQQREIVQFMETELGEWRRDRQRMVDSEVRKPALALQEVLEVSQVEELLLAGDGSIEHAHVSSRVHAEPERRRWLAPIAALLIAAVAAVVLLSLRTRDARLPERALPAESPALAPSPKPEPEHAAAAAQPDAASGLPSAPSLAEEPPSAPSAARGKSRPGSVRPAAPRAPAAPAAAAPAAPAAPARNCTPPYILDNEGVKTYKPECL